MVLASAVLTRVASRRTADLQRVCGTSNQHRRLSTPPHLGEPTGLTSPRGNKGTRAKGAQGEGHRPQPEKGHRPGPEPERDQESARKDQHEGQTAAQPREAQGGGSEVHDRGAMSMGQAKGGVTSTGHRGVLEGSACQPEGTANRARRASDQSREARASSSLGAGPEGEVREQGPRPGSGKERGTQPEDRLTDRKTERQTDSQTVRERQRRRCRDRGRHRHRHRNRQKKAKSKHTAHLADCLKPL